MPTLQVVVTSTREQRAGDRIAHWFVDRAGQHGGFAVELVDLRDFALPLFDEPKHPRFGQYAHEHTKRWSARVARADAFVFVVPEYNHGAPPALINALDYLFAEWAYKPAGFVSYGGAAGGARSVEMAKIVLTTLKIVPLPETVAIPFFTNHLDASGAFKGGEPFDKSATVMLDELLRWTDALRPLRSRS